MLESSKSKQCKLVQFLHEFVADYPAQSDTHWNIQKTSFPAIFHHKIFSVTTLSIMFIARLKYNFFFYSIVFRLPKPQNIAQMQYPS